LPGIQQWEGVTKLATLLVDSRQAIAREEPRCSLERLAALERHRALEGPNGP
jgi:hypothetical protein